MAKGDISVDGNGPDSASFQGLMFGGAALRASRLSLVGSFIGTSRESAGSAIELDQVHLVSNPQAISFDFPKIFTLDVPADVIPHAIGPGSITARDALDPNLVTDQSVCYRFSDGYLATSHQQMMDYTAGQDVVHDIVTGTFPSVDHSTQNLVAALRAGVATADKLYQKARQRGLERGRFSLDPNQFMQTSDKMRRMLWRVIE